MNLREYRIELGWSLDKLAAEAKINRRAALNAESGNMIRAKTAKAIADALSEAYGKAIRVMDIEGLNIQ